MSLDFNKKYDIGDIVPQTGYYTCHDSKTGDIIDFQHSDTKGNPFPPKPGHPNKGDCYYTWSPLN